MALPWEIGLAAVFISGVVFFLMTFLKIRELIIDAVPGSLKRAIAVGIGLVGIKTLSIGSPVASEISRMLLPVTKPSDQMPSRGYWMATTRLNSISRSLNTKSVTCLTLP